MALATQRAVSGPAAIGIPFQLQVNAVSSASDFPSEFLANVPGPLVIVDGEGAIVDANPAARVDDTF